MIVNFVVSLVIFLIALVYATEATSFLAVGDWGGLSFRPYYTPGQAASVIGMDKIATELKSEFVLAVGDNFYFTGVVDEFDERFRLTFEDVYTPSSLQTPWYAVLGNHDYKGNTTAQIEYTKHSPRWRLSTNYYTKSFTAEDGATIDLIVIDTVNLSSANAQMDEEEEGYFDPLPAMPRSYATEQWDWIESQLKGSKADYVLVAGHYPIYSACEHGNTENLVTNLLPLLQQYNAQYISGHDHCLEHIVDPAVPNVNHFLSGMGATCCYRLSNRNGVPKQSLKFYVALDNKNGAKSGFNSFEVSKSGLVVKYYDQDGTVLYTAPTIAPRPQN